jgi:glycosyltransferase involved in cell wall biosynthesis
LSQKHDITVLSINDWWKGSQGDLESYSSDFKDIFSKIDYYYLTNRKIPPFIQEVIFTKKIKELSKHDFDVHLNYNSLITGYRVSKHFKTLFDLADDIPEMIRRSPQIPKLFSPLGGLMGDYYLKKNIKIANSITLTTSELKKNYKIPNEKIKIVSNGVDTENFIYYKKSKEKYGFEGFIVGYVGVLREWVDLKPVFMALKQLDEDIKLLVVGSEGRFKENVKLAIKYGLEDRVIFTGMIPYSSVPHYISAMDVGIIPFSLNMLSHHALPMKLFEYMSCEKPVISSPILPVQNSVGNNVLYASNTEEYIEKIKLLYENNHLRKEMAKKGRKIALNHDWQSMSELLESYLLEIIN